VAAAVHGCCDGADCIGFVLVAVFAQILRNWLLHAVGVEASFFDAIGVLIAVVTLAWCSAASLSQSRFRLTAEAWRGTKM
jgi:hypothetical protein